MLRARRAVFGTFTLLAVTLAIEAPAQAEPAQTHHGLYVRLAAGASYFSDSVESDPIPPFGKLSGTLKGGAISTQAAIGGTILPGLIVGGTLFVHYLPGPSTTNASASGGLLSAPVGDIDFDPTTLTVIGPFVDYYFNPRSGLHAQASIGYGILSLGQGNDRGSGVLAVHDQKGSGVSAVLGGGYEWWVSDSWGVGVLGQLMMGWGSGDDTTNHTWTHRILIPGILVSATMN